ncbi:caspase family protein [Streptomyces sp. NPDC006992]|uniref:caspase family protein n=1 Tax=Streptomyces sp. NPDC006992 TaxID=3155601 RepID=UPI0033D83174
MLVGIHDYAVLENLPSVARNLVGLKKALTDPEVWGLPPEACTVIEQPGSAGLVLDTVREQARLAQDTLLVYYAGHGLTDAHTDELYLTLPDSDPEREYTSMRYEYLRRAVLDPLARAKRTIVILDCCYSGRALIGEMGASMQVADQAVVAGTYLLTASAETRPALSPPGEKYTAFTGELVAALTEGIVGGPDLLDMNTLYRYLHQCLVSKSRPLPQQRNRNTGGLIAIARNRAVSRTPVIPNEASFVAWQKEPETYHVGTVVDEARGAPQSSAENGIRQTLLDADQLARALAADLDRDFSPFWFAVPVARWMAREDGSLDPVTELVPGVWYLAVGQRGHAIVAQSQDGRRGLLLDTSGIQRG